METENFDSLKPNPKNPRHISKEDYEALKKSILTFGDLSGIVKNQRTGQLVGGHMRTRAFKELSGEKRVIITERLQAPNQVGTIAIGYVTLNNEFYSYRIVDWAPEVEAAANIAANRIQGQFDLDLLAQVNYELSQLENGSDLLGLTGQTKDEIDRLLDMVGANGESDPEEDEAPEVDEVNPPVSKLGEIYQLGSHRLMCGDATDFGAVSDLMDGKLADLVFTDPPYNVDYEGKTEDSLKIQNDKFKTSEDFFTFLLNAFTNMFEVSKDGASIYICHADIEGLNFRKSMEESGWLLKQCIIWKKNTMVLGRQDYQWAHEPILYGWKEGAAHYFVPDRDLTTVWEFNKPAKSTDHPTMKPVALVKQAIKNSSKREGLVLDLFGGSGSTLIAADELDRICYTMELDPKYCDVIRKRYHKHKTDTEEGWEAATSAVQNAEVAA